MTNGTRIIHTHGHPPTLAGNILPMSTRITVYEPQRYPRWFRTLRAWLGYANPAPKILRSGAAPGMGVAIVAQVHTPGKRMKIHSLCVAKNCAGWTIDRLLVDGRHALLTPFVATEEANRIDVSGTGKSFAIFATNTTDRTEDLFASLLGDLVDQDDVVTEAEVWS